jgi:hypothetical protein
MNGWSSKYASGLSKYKDKFIFILILGNMNYISIRIILVLNLSQEMSVSNFRSSINVQKLFDY